MALWPQTSSFSFERDFINTLNVRIMFKKSLKVEEFLLKYDTCDAYLLMSAVNYQKGNVFVYFYCYTCTHLTRAFYVQA